MSMALDGQEIEMIPHFRSFADCELCAQAYANAMKSHAIQGVLLTWRCLNILITQMCMSIGTLVFGLYCACNFIMPIAS